MIFWAAIVILAATVALMAWTVRLNIRMARRARDARPPDG